MGDTINHPDHYKAYSPEIINFTEPLDFCTGNTLKYLARAGLKDPGTKEEDLAKADWYINRIIETKGASAAREQLLDVARTIYFSDLEPQNLRTRLLRRLEERINCITEKNRL